MKQLVEFVLDDGNTILVEAIEPESDGIEPVALEPGKIAAKAKQTFEKTLATIKPLASKIVSELKEIDEPADEIEVKFGIKLSGQVGAVLTAGGEANYEVTLKWNRSQSKQEN